MALSSAHNNSQQALLNYASNIILRPAVSTTATVGRFGLCTQPRNVVFNLCVHKKVNCPWRRMTAHGLFSNAGHLKYQERLSFMRHVVERNKNIGAWAYLVSDELGLPEFFFIKRAKYVLYHLIWCAFIAAFCPRF